MTREENIKVISGVLDNMGIDSNVIREELFTKINSGIPVFNILYKHDFNGEEMEFSLQFKQNLLSGDYSMESYKAEYKDRKFPLVDRTLNGVNLGELRSQMQQVNWNRFFSNSTSVLSNTEAEHINHIFLQLEQLRTGEMITGVQRFAELMFKFFPEEGWHPVIRELLFGFIHNDIINIENDPDHKIITDYYELSGVLDNYMRAASTLNLYDLYTYNLREYLKEHLTKKGIDGTFQFVVNNDKGVFKFMIPLLENGGAYKPATYEVSFYPLKPLPDVTISAVKVPELAAQFRNVNWRNEFLYGTGSDNETFEKRLERIEKSLAILTASEPGRRISFQLQMVYWGGCRKYHDRIHPDAWKELPSHSVTFPGYVTAPSAMRVLSGDAVLVSYGPEFNKGFDKWPQIAVPTDNGKKQIFISFPDFVAKNIGGAHKFDKQILVDDKSKSCNKGKLPALGEVTVAAVPHDGNKLQIKIPELFKGSIERDISIKGQQEASRKKFEVKPTKKKRGLKH